MNTTCLLTQNKAKQSKDSLPSPPLLPTCSSLHQLWPALVLVPHRSSVTWPNQPWRHPWYSLPQSPWDLGWPNVPPTCGFFLPHFPLLPCPRAPQPLSAGPSGCLTQKFMPSDTCSPFLALPRLSRPIGSKLQVPMVAFKTAIRLMVGTEKAIVPSGFATSIIYAVIARCLTIRMHHWKAIQLICFPSTHVYIRPQKTGHCCYLRNFKTGSQTLATAELPGRLAGL